MGTIVILAGSVMLVVLVTLLIIESNRALSQLIKLPFNPLLVPAENAFKAGLLALAVGLMVGSQRPLASYGWGRLEASHALLGMLAGTISVALVNWISSLAVEHWGARIASSLVIRAIVPQRRGQWPLVALAMGLAVLLEEALFRALPLGGWAPPLPLWLVIVITAALFGLLHTVQGPLAVGMAFVLGIAWSLLFVWTGSLWPSVIAHYLFNLTQLLIAAHWPRLLPT